METLQKIKQLHDKINQSIFQIDPEFSYLEIIEALIILANLIKNYEGETEDWIYIGELSHCTISDLLCGTYWHFTEWHNGQNSQSYAALCVIGKIFTPGMTNGPEPDSSELNVYNALNELAEEFYKQK